jgi:protein-disulfide isomerase
LTTRSITSAAGQRGASSSSTATTNARTRAERFGRSRTSSDDWARHFPLTEIHPHALAAAAAAEAAALQGGFWNMHELLFRRQTALEDDDLRLYAVELELDVARFDSDRTGAAVLGRVRRDMQSGIASGEVRGTPTLFIDGVVHRGGYDAATLLEALAG